MAAIYLRHARGREPTDEEIERYVMLHGTHVRRRVSGEDVRNAFLNGEEVSFTLIVDAYGLIYR